jgi:hypothetical protein
MDERNPGLDDPDYAAFAWGRYWRIMRWMALVSLGCVLAALGFLWWRHGTLPIHLIIATAAGIGFTALLTAALMGLMFMSSGTGHDERVEDPLKDKIDIDD